MTSETPCVLGCRTITDDIIEAEVFHAEGCPNAPKPAEPRKRVMIVGSGISAALAAVMTAKPAEPPACGCDTFDVMGRSYGHDIGCSNHAKPEPQSEPPIDWGLMIEITDLRAVRGGLEMRLQTELAKNAALKVRVDDLENLVLDIDDGQEAATVYARAIRARRQEASNGK